MFVFGLVEKDTYVACRIFEKSGSGPKNGEKYGAPFVEAEWEGVDNRVDPLPAVDNEPLKQIVPSVPAIDNELLKQIVPVPAASGDDYVEADDLKQVCIISQMMLDYLYLLELEF